MKRGTPEETGRAMDALGLWDVLRPCNWAVKAAGRATPWFCTVAGDKVPGLKARFLMIEGWQSFHDFVRLRIDPSFGFLSGPADLPHFEMAVADGGDVQIARFDPGVPPRPLEGGEKDLCARILWEAYGVMMRIETDRSLPMKYAEDKALFCRTEVSPGVWEDRPLVIPDPPPHVERVALDKEQTAKAKDLPFAKSEVLAIDFRRMPGVFVSSEGWKRPRGAFRLCAIEVEGGNTGIMENVAPGEDGAAGLRGVWEAVPSRVLKLIIDRGRVPGEIRTVSPRVFRLLRPLCIELPFKLSLRDSIPALEAAISQPPAPPPDPTPGREEKKDAAAPETPDASA